MKSFAKRVAPLMLGVVMIAVAGSAPADARTPAKKPAGAGAVTEHEGGHILGDPEAPNHLIEFMSYTCSHCADFARTGEGAIKLAYIPTGKVNLEIRHFIRDPIDMTAALLTQCGPTAKFPANHSAIILKQDEWLAKARTATQAQRARWQFGTHSARFQAIASDLGFYDIMISRGYTRAALDICLSDTAKADAIAETSRADVAKYGLLGTPSFVLNGTLLENVYGWEALRPHLDKFFTKPRS